MKYQGVCFSQETGGKKIAEELVISRVGPVRRHVLMPQKGNGGVVAGAEEPMLAVMKLGGKGKVEMGTGPAVG